MVIVSAVFASLGLAFYCGVCVGHARQLTQNLKMVALLEAMEP